jgi:hypothetical protein
MADPQRGSSGMAARFCAAIGADELRLIEVTPHDYQPRGGTMPSAKGQRLTLLPET